MRSAKRAGAARSASCRRGARAAGCRRHRHRCAARSGRIGCMCVGAWPIQMRRQGPRSVLALCRSATLDCAHAAPELPRQLIVSPREETRGLMLGPLGVVIFALTLPMTRWPSAAASDPQLPPLFVTAGRARGPACSSVAYLWLTRAPRPRPRSGARSRCRRVGTVVGFPLFLALALRHVDCDACRGGHRRAAARHRGRRRRCCCASARRSASGPARWSAARWCSAFAWQARRRAAARRRLLLLAVLSRVARLRRRRAAVGADAGRAGDLLGARAVACRSRCR